jgi:predicted transcriptional regulator
MVIPRRYHRSMAMTLRLTDEETELLRRTAEAEDRSMQDVAREAIREYTSRHTARRDAALARIVSEDGALLDRLGSV